MNLTHNYFKKRVNFNQIYLLFHHHDHHELYEHHLQLALLHRANPNIIKYDRTNCMAIFGQGHQKQSFSTCDDLKCCFW